MRLTPPIPISSRAPRSARLVRQRAYLALSLTLGAACGSAADDAPPGENAASQSVDVASPWTSSGPGQRAISAASDVDVTFDYQDLAAAPASWDRWTVSTTASATGHVVYAWDTSGLHGSVEAHAKLTAFADGSSGRVSVPLVDSGTSDRFRFHGTVELDVAAGSAFGFVVEGENSDPVPIVLGTLRLRRLTPLADAVPDPNGWSAAKAGSGAFALGASTAVGRLAGQSGVSATGAATYSIPIQVPPGTGGAAPTLSLSYDSQARNGALGVGFRLAGVSSITRCAPNFVDDGRRGGVRVTADDRFCLDGAELVAIQGTYGADGTVYRLHRDDWTKVVSKGACGGGPCSFVATSRDGETAEFGSSDGATDASAVPATDKPVDATHPVLQWSVARQIDTDGNEVQYKYTYSSVDGEQLPSKVLYSANARTGAPARRAVTFEYEARNDASVVFVGGAKIGLARRLTKVRTSVDDVAVTEYRLTYEQRPTTDRSRLHSVTECDASGVCLPETTFAWSDGSAGFDRASAFDTKGPSLRSDANSYAVTPSGVYADFDGDGLTDYAEAACSTPDCSPRVWRGGSKGFTLASFTLPGPVNIVSTGSSVSTVGGVVVDVNGDGRADYVRGVCFDNTCKLDVWRSTGQGFVADVELRGIVAGNVPLVQLPLFRVDTSGSHTQQVGSLVDIDGDGVLDYVAGVCRSGTPSCDNSIYLRTNDGYRLAPFSLPGPLVQAESNGWRVQELGALIDLDGDHIADYVAGTCDERSNCDYQVYRGTGSSFEKAFKLPGPILQRESTGWRARQVGVLKDFNGDGIADYVSAACPDNGGACDRAVWFGTGRDFVKSGFSLPGPLFKTESAGWRARQEGTLEDFNGDGFVDYVAGTCVDGPTSKCDLTISLGSRGGFLSSSTTVPAGLFQIASQTWDIKRKGVLIDMNGDGALDYSAATCPTVGTACDQAVRLGQAAASDRLLSVTDGFQLRTSFDYAPLTRPGVYTAKAPAAATGVEARWPLYVVSRYTVDDQKALKDDQKALKKDYAYTYEQSWSDRARREWMGFGRITRTDLVSQHTVVTSYLQEDPSIGTPTEVIESDGAGNVLRASTWTLERVADPALPAIVRHRPTEVRSRVYALGGAVETRKTYTYDARDSVTVLVESTTGGATRKTCRTYAYPTGTAHLVDLVEEKVGSETMACGQVWTPSTDLSWRRFSYTANGHLAVESAWLDTTRAWIDTKSFYDAYGNAVAVVDANGAASTVEFDDLHTFPRYKRAPAAGGAPAVDETLVHDPRFGAVLTRTLASGVTFRTQHDAFGRPLGEYGPRPDGTKEVVLTTYTDGTDAIGPYVTSTVQIAWDGSRGAATVASRADVDAWGGVARRTYANRIVTETKRDARGRASEASAPHFATDAAALSTLGYDESDRVTQRTDPDGVVHTYAYTASNGLVTTATEPSGTGSVTHSGRGAEISRTLPNGAIVTSTTDALDRVTKLVDPVGLVHTMTYDSLGRITSETTPDTGTTTFAYDDVGHRVSSTDADGKHIRTRFDLRGRVVEEHIDGPDGEKVVTNQYDAGRFGWGLLSTTTTTQASGATSSEAFEYDAYGHVTKRTMTIAGRTFVSSFETGPTGIVDRVTHPNGTIVTTSHDDRGLPTHIDVTENGATSTYATFGDYDAAAKARDVSYLNGVKTRFEYDTGAQAVGMPLIVRASVNGSLILQQSYKWSSSRWLESVDDTLVPASSRTYHYDAMGYLKDAVSSKGTQTYEYDLAGAFVAKEGVAYTYVSGTHRVASTSDGGTFAYAANGNRTRMSRGGVDTSYEYDAADSLLTVRRGSEVRQRFEYDGAGNRYAKLDADGTRTLYVSPSDEITISPTNDELYTLYVHGAHGRVAAITRTSPAGASLSGGAGAGALARAGSALGRMLHATGATSARMILIASTIAVGAGVLAVWAVLAWGAGALTSAGSRRRRVRAALVPVLAGLVVLTSSPSYAALTAAAGGPGRPEAGVVFFHEDPTSSTLLVTGAQGEVVARTAYTPFGEIDPEGSSGRDGFRPKFSGKEWEADAGAYYFGARYYDAKLGSFLTPDAARQYPSAYTYAGNNPRSVVDPDGNNAVELALLITASILTSGMLGGIIISGGLMGAATYAAATPESERSSAGWAKAIGIGVGINYAAALVGAAVGAGVGAAAGMAAAAAGMTATSVAVTTTTGVVAGAVAGAADAATSQLLTNAAYDRPLDEGLGMAVGMGAGIGAVTGGVGGYAESRAGAGAMRGVAAAFRGAPCEMSCFVAGTTVATVDGPSPIEDIREGDWVYAYNEATDALELRQVISLFHREAPSLVKIDVGDDIIRVTPEHPFWVDGVGWRQAGDLEIGDRLVSLDGRIVTVQDTRTESRAATVYNFEVEEAHTYFVSNEKTLVHNCWNQLATAARRLLAAPERRLALPKPEQRLALPEFSINPFQGQPRTSVLKEPMTVYRVSGGASNPRGRWFMKKIPASREQAASGWALPMEGEGAASQMGAAELPAGTTVVQGRVAPNFGRPGGEEQVYVRDNSAVKFNEPIPLESGSPLNFALRHPW